MNNRYYFNASKTDPSPPEQSSQFGKPFPQPQAPPERRQRSCFSCASWISCLVLISIILCVLTAGVTFLPGDISLLVLGIDRAPDKSFVGRSDTIIMTTFDPIKPYVGMLSVPRDLWVTIPDVGENRINTAHFFAEANQPGSGPFATLATIEYNTGVKIQYYVRIRFDSLVDIVDAMGGIDIELKEPMGGYEPGHYHLNGNKTLAFARHRLGSDDFFRMKSGQFLIKSILKQLFFSKKITSVPQVLLAALNSTDTNLPVWQLPRVLITVLMVGFDDIDNQVIDREMVTSYITSEGASVLLPEWSLIMPVINNMFGQ